MKKIIFAFILVFAAGTVFTLTPEVNAAKNVSPALEEKARKGQKLTKKEKNILRSAGLINKKGKWIGPRAVANPRPAEGNRVDQGTVTPDRPICRDYESYRRRGPDLNPVKRNGKDMCPPAYECAAQQTRNGCVFGCLKRHHGDLYAGERWCRWDDCTGICK